MGLEADMEDGEGNWRKEDGGPAFLEVERDGRVRIPTPAAPRVRYLQELRRALARRLHGWQRRGHAGQGHFVRTEEGCCSRGQEEMRDERVPEAQFVYQIRLECAECCVHGPSQTRF